MIKFSEQIYSVRWGLGIFIYFLSAALLFELHSQALSSYYTKGKEWQETIALSIKFFHKEKNQIEKILGNKDIIDFGEWYLSGPFPGKPEDLFKAKFGPEYNSGLKQEYIEDKNGLRIPNGQMDYLSGLKVKQLRFMTFSGLSNRLETWKFLLT